MNKDQAIEAICSADISQDDWEHGIIQSLPAFARGYVEGRLYDWFESGLRMDRDGQQFLLGLMECDIWK